MMPILSLKDNALFLQTFRERMRFSAVVAGIILAVIIISLIVLQSYVNKSYYHAYNPTSHGYSTSNRIEIFWGEAALWGVSVGQGILLLLIGTLSASRMAIRERASGTLDFHRSSPTSRLNQIIGLVFGAPSLEWCIYGMTVLFSFYLTIISEMPVGSFFRFHGSLILCTVFYHSLAVFIGIWDNRKEASAAPRFGIGKIFFIVFGLFFIFGVFSESKLASLYHITWLPVFDPLHQHIYPESYKYVNPYSNRHLLTTFFWYTVPSGLFQTLVQLPLLGLTWTGISRKISHPDRPAFSKSQSVLAIFFILFLFTGSGVSSLLLGNTHGYYYSYTYVKELGGFFLFLILFLGIVAVLDITPTRGLFAKGLRKMKKLELKRLDRDEDYSSNLNWLSTAGFSIAVIYTIFMYTFSAPLIYKTSVLVIVLLYIAFFASALEYFRLSQHYQKKMLFWTGLSILWLFIPIFGFIITDKVMASSRYDFIFMAASPFFGPGSLITALDQTRVLGRINFDLILSFLINGSLTTVMAFLAFKERQAYAKEILGK